jgi:hypothetical protein
MEIIVKRIESNEYFNAVKKYFADNREPARVHVHRPLAVNLI